MRWLKIVLFLIALAAISRINISLGNTGIYVAPDILNASYVWTDTPCGKTTSTTLATTTVSQINVSLSPGCHSIQSVAKVAGIVVRTYPAIQLTINRPGKPLNVTVGK